VTPFIITILYGNSVEILKGDQVPWANGNSEASKDSGPQSILGADFCSQHDDDPFLLLFI
jgi:hypothetical protein